MYIKRIIIKGFKTYRNETIIDDLSPHQNIIIGSNGSGKSNLFSAIRFVLSDDYSNLKREERQGLIHQGSAGNSVMSASVEIIFHDPTGKIVLSSFNVPPKPNNEIHIRRTIGLKKDDYQVNDRNVSKGDIFRILESAGFSINNPYNIVPQGKIIALTNAKDNERLKLLEDVVGAKSFEIKLSASLKKMNDTDRKMKEIEKEMLELKSKLKEMNAEKIELEKYNDLERNRKVLQFTLFDRELNNVLNQLEKIDDEYNVTFNESKQYTHELDVREEMIANINEQLQNIENRLKIKIRTDQQQAKALYDEASANLIDLNVQVSDLKKQLGSNDDQIKKDEKALDIILEEIKTRNRKLDAITPKFKELSAEEREMKVRLNDLQQRKRELLLKRGKYTQFTSEEERNNWINGEIAEHTASLANLKTVIVANNQERESLETSIQTLTEEIADLIDSIQGPSITAELEDISEQQSLLKQQYVVKIDERKELWRTEQKLTTVLENFSKDLKSFQSNVNETMSRDLSSGITSVQEITQKLKLPSSSVYGTVGELIKVSDKYKTCAEIVGGNSLFNIVVDTDDTASLLMAELNRMKGGRVTFVPLNRITPESNFEMPSASSQEGKSVQFTPLMKKIKYDSKFEPVIQHIFGRTVVVKHLDSGLKLAKQFNLNAITLDGDRADKKGALTGGYYDYHKRTRLDALKSLTQARKKQEKTTLELTDIKQQLEKVDAEVDDINGKIRSLTNRREIILTTTEQMRLKQNSKKNEIIILQDSLEAIIARNEKAMVNVEKLESKIETYKEDLAAGFDPEDAQKKNTELEHIIKDIDIVTNDLNVTSNTLEDLTLMIDKIKAELESKLIPQKDYLETRISTAEKANAIESNEELDELLSRVKSITDQKKELAAQLDAIQREIDGLHAEKSNNEKILDKANTQQTILVSKIENFQKSAEKIMVKRATLLGRREELQRKIREVGLLSEDILNNFAKLSSEELLEKLTSTNQDISMLTNINKRALENFKKFGEKETELIERSEELTVSKTSIQELIEKLKSQKATAVDSTFKKVSENFAKVFERLVPAGTAKLIIQKVDDSNMDQDMDSDIPATQQTEMYSGVTISVSFNSKQNEQLHVEQLSGGQKTLCAIALILAIQMVDPAPFYLFDEIDAALDKQYRTAVASILKELSANAQFICTTFRTDMLEVADKFFRVKYENKISTVVEVQRDEAIKFIRGSNKMREV